MTRKSYKIKTTCPQCGCSAVSHLSEEEIKERYGDVPNVTLECHQCQAIMEANVEEDTDK